MLWESAPERYCQKKAVYIKIEVTEQFQISTNEHNMYNFVFYFRFSSSMC